MPPAEEALDASQEHETCFGAALIAAYDLAAAIQYDIASLFDAYTVTMVEESSTGGRFTFDNGNGVVLEVLVRPTEVSHDHPER